VADRALISKAQQRALSRLSGLAVARKVYLAGGVAVAFHLEHRRSNDLDFFSLERRLDLSAVRREILKGAEAEVVALTDATLHLRLEGADVDFVRYEYPPLAPPRQSPLGVRVAHLRDLAAMKLAAIAKRGIRRDFWDLHEMLSRGATTLPRALRDYRQKFGVAEADLYHVLRALTWFADAEAETAFPRGLTSAKWRTIRSDVEKWVAELPVLRR
jgi:predicted nucleotidyltransferase component of viral defense system